LIKRRPRVQPNYSLIDKEASDRLRAVLIKVSYAYVVVAVLVPIVAWFFVVLTGKNSTDVNIARFYLLTANFFKSVADSQVLFPGPRDFVLAAIVVLYRRRWKVALGLLFAAALIYLIGLFLFEQITHVITGLGPTSIGALILETLCIAFMASTLASVLFAPAFCAFKEKMKWRIILPMNLLLGFIPPIWIVLCFFCVKPVEVKKKSVVPAKKDAASRTPEEGTTPQAAISTQEPKKKSKLSKRKRK
jgi:hypothetical protein